MLSNRDKIQLHFNSDILKIDCPFLSANLSKYNKNYDSRAWWIIAQCFKQKKHSVWGCVLMKQLLMSLLGYKEYLEWPFNQESIHKPITQYKLFGTKHTVKVWVLSFSPRLNYFIPVWLIFTQFNNFYFVICNMS